MLIALIVFLVLLAVLFFFWVMRSMIHAACPQCLEEGDEEMVIPLIPGFRWFCPACGGAYRNSEVREAGERVRGGSEEAPAEEQ